MRKSWLIVSLLVLPFLRVLFLQSLMPGKQTTASLHAEDVTIASHLPAVFAPEETATPTATVTPTPTATPTAKPSPTPGLINGSFEDCIQGPVKCEWHIDENANQPPRSGWELYQVPKGEKLWGSEDLASEVSEAKHLEQPFNIPEHEWVGKPDAIILEGKVTYKIFSQSESFGTELRQTVTLQPGDSWRLTVPINVHLHEETDANAVESSVTVNGEPQHSWSNGFEMVDRRFCKHTVVFTVPQDGQVDISIKVKSKYRNAKDFFIDDITLKPASEQAPYPEMADCMTHLVLGRQR